ncbi:hypothetical protein MKW92_026135 [Papaver armeniacum]|nr:hypothetical protein MKW92_026135 [Papaver armeniacum]
MLRGQLQTIKRGARSVAEFIQEVKSITDSLAAIKEKVADVDIVMHILNGLGRDYDNVVIVIHNLETQISFADMKAKLLTHEQWLKAQQLETYVALESVTNSTFFSTKSFASGSGSSRSVRSNDSASRSDRPPSPWIDYSTVECQICKKTGVFG